MENVLHSRQKGGNKKNNLFIVDSENWEVVEVAGVGFSKD